MYNFGPAVEDEEIVFGAQRPGKQVPFPQESDVLEWISFMKSKGIQRVLCLLADDQLPMFPFDLIELYRQHFGDENVCHVPIIDFNLAKPEQLEHSIFPFLKESDQLKLKVVVHCSGGSGRTGHVLAAWLVYGRNYEIDEALKADHSIPGVLRNPREAVRNDETEAEFKELFEAVVEMKRE